MTDDELSDRPEEEPGFQPEIEWRFLEGDDVVGRDDEDIGIVVGFHPEDPENGMPDYLLVEHGGIFGSNNLYIPFAAVDHYDVDRIILRVSSADVANQGWDVEPPGVGAED
ncbi:MAG: PRC-barrel domain-containing protein [Thermomicrobiales bacterium]